VVTQRARITASDSSKIMWEDRLRRTAGFPDNSVAAGAAGYAAALPPGPLLGAGGPCAQTMGIDALGQATATCGNLDQTNPRSTSSS
jgi:hypothetical protein